MLVIVFKLYVFYILKAKIMRSMRSYKFELKVFINFSGM